ncbi:hypothetical protein D3C75_759610 [compost metagenome]
MGGNTGRAGGRGPSLVAASRGAYSYENPLYLGNAHQQRLPFKSDPVGLFKGGSGGGFQSEPDLAVIRLGQQFSVYMLNQDQRKEENQSRCPINHPAVLQAPAQQADICIR